jgi:hypothetical protein
MPGIVFHEEGHRMNVFSGMARKKLMRPQKNGFLGKVIRQRFGSPDRCRLPLGLPIALYPVASPFDVSSGGDS